MNRADAFKVTVDRGMRLREGRWDGTEARAQIFRYAETDGEMDWAKAARGHTVADLDPEGRDEPTRADLKLPIAMVEEGELVGVGNGLRAALSRLPQTDGLSAAVRTEAEGVLRTMLDKLNEQTAADMVEALGITLDAARSLVACAESRIMQALADGAMPETIDEAVASIRDADAQTAIIDEMSRGGQVFRCSRVTFDLADELVPVVDRALAIGERLDRRGDADQAEVLRSIADELRTDGFADHLTPDGFLMLPVQAARTGTQRYTDGVNTWWELRPDDEVGAPESLASYGLKSLTDDHPADFVTSVNYTRYTRGTCGQDAILLDEVAEDGNRYVRLTILVGDIGMLRKIRAGKLELSAGYTMVPVADEGVDPNGVRYTFRQTRIRINHLALVDKGRAGPLARISLDGCAWELAPLPQGDTTDMGTTDTNQDQLDPEAATMLLGAVAAFMMPETPEAQAAALEQIANITGLEPDNIRAMLSGGESSMEEVELDEEITAKMTPDAAAKWKAARAAADKRAADAAAAATTSDAQVTELRTKLADQGGELAAMRRQVDRLARANDKAELDALEREIADACPQLAAAWTERRSKDAKFTMTATEMRKAALLDLDPGAAEDLAAHDDPATLDSFIASQYRTTMRLANKRGIGRGTNDNDDNAGAGGTVINFDALNAAIGVGFYGVQPPSTKGA